MAAPFLGPFAGRPADPNMWQDATGSAAVRKTLDALSGGEPIKPKQKRSMGQALKGYGQGAVDTAVGFENWMRTHSNDDRARIAGQVAQSVIQSLQDYGGEISDYARRDPIGTPAQVTIDALSLLDPRPAFRAWQAADDTAQREGTRAAYGPAAAAGLGAILALPGIPGSGKVGQLTADAVEGAAKAKAVKSVAEAVAGSPPRLDRSTPGLIAAVRHNGKVYTGADHMAALEQIPSAERQAATLNGNNRGFLTERGRFLDRAKAADYARDWGLFKSDAPSWAATAPEAIAENIQPPTMAAVAETGAQKVAKAAVGKPVAAARGIINTPDLRPMTWDDALTTARTEPHLIPRPAGAEGSMGYYVGSPGWLSSPEDLDKMRFNVDAKTIAGAGSGIDRWWYDTGRDFVRQIAGPDPERQSMIARGLGHFSPQADPPTNQNAFLQAFNAHNRGAPRAIVRNGERAQSFNAAMDAADPQMLARGNKVDPYARNFDPTTPPPPVGANDRHHARVFGYQGDEGDVNLSDSQHRFLDYETVLAADRANAGQVGGRSDWTGPRVQETAWIEEKAQRLMQQRPKLTYDEALAIARTGYADSANDVTLSMTGEHIPYGNAGFDLGDMTFDQKLGYTNRAPWTDAEGRDRLAQSFGYPTRPSQQGAGYWMPDGAVDPEINPAEVHRPMVGWDSFPINEKEAAKGTGFSGRTISPEDYNAMSYLQGVRGLMDVQAGEPFHALATQNSLSKFGVKNDPRTSFRVEFGRQPNEAEMRALNDAGLGLDVWNASDGVTLRNWGDQMPPIDEVNATVQGIIPGASVVRGAPSVPGAPNVDGYGYPDALGNYMDLSSELERPGEGLATMKTLDRESILTDADRARVNDPGSDFNRTIMDAAGDRLGRITDYNLTGQRPDYETLFRLLNEGGVPRVKQWIAENGPKGLPVVLAASTLPAFQQEYGQDQPR